MPPALFLSTAGLASAGSMSNLRYGVLMFLALLVGLGVIFLVVVALLRVSHRRYSIHAPKSPPPTPDPWHESARRFHQDEPAD